MNRFSIKITGPAGFGIKSTGIILAKIFLRQGFFVFAYTEYPSLIRGGHNTYQIDLADQPIYSAGGQCDILIALDEKSIKVENKNLKNNGIILSDVFKDNKKENKIIKIPFTELAKQAGGEVMRNTVALGALMEILQMDLSILNKLLQEEFKDKKEIGGKNIKAAEMGRQEIRNQKLEIRNFKTLISNFSISNFPKTLITGNQACAVGIIASQCKLYVAYPMTPSTEILHFLENKQRETNMIVHQPEDEIAGIHAALGGSFAGVRSATGSSGGGFALMNEGLSLAGMLELPLVIFEVQRPGPATGNPTWTEQGDLLYAINAGHGEFPKIVLGPGDPAECFSLTQKAFNLADKYQLPVIILSDKFLGESSYSIDKNIFEKIEKVDRGKILTSHNQQLTANNYQRYKFSQDGISWRTIPGVGGGEHSITGVEHSENGVRAEYIANSDEHSADSFSDESSEIRKKMMEKRMKKLEILKKEIPFPKIYGPKKADLTLVCWGSQLGPCLDAISLKHKNKKTQKQINIIHFSYLWPLPNNLDKFLQQFKKLILVENNYNGQLGQLIRQETGLEIKDKILKYNSRPFWPEEIVEKIEKI